MLIVGFGVFNFFFAAYKKYFVILGKGGGGGVFIYVKFLTYLSSVLKRVNCFSPGV